MKDITELRQLLKSFSSLKETSMDWNFLEDQIRDWHQRYQGVGTSMWCPHVHQLNGWWQWRGYFSAVDAREIHWNFCPECGATRPDIDVLKKAD